MITEEFLKSFLALRKTGLTEAQTLVKLGISKNKFRKFYDNVDSPLYDDFIEVVELSKTHEQAMLEEIGIALMNGKVQFGKEGVWKKLIETKCEEYRLSQNVNIKTETDSPEQIQAKLDELMKKAGE